MVPFHQMVLLDSTRFCLRFILVSVKDFIIRAVLVNGQVPGPLIVANKVSHIQDNFEDT
jgi:hypothetical protein